MEERNQYLEHDGLYFESDTHEWFLDKSSSQYAQTDNGLNTDALKNIVCFVVRNKSNGEYERVVMDKVANEVIYATGSLDDIGAFIDKLKIMKRFNIK
jgi:hypothetical protein